jgi:hypothetical protein
MGLPSRIANQKYGTRTSAVAQVDNEEKSPSWFGNPRLRPPELIAQHLAGLHKAFSAKVSKDRATPQRTIWPRSIQFER